MSHARTVTRDHPDPHRVCSHRRGLLAVAGACRAIGVRPHHHARPGVLGGRSSHPSGASEGGVGVPQRFNPRWVLGRSPLPRTGGQGRLLPTGPLQTQEMCSTRSLVLGRALTAKRPLSSDPGSVNGRAVVTFFLDSVPESDYKTSLRLRLKPKPLSGGI